MDKIKFTKISHDINGNPRYVVPFDALLSKFEKKTINDESKRYALAVEKANTIGGKRYKTRQYGNGIVFDSFSLDETEKAIQDVAATDLYATFEAEYTDTFGGEANYAWVKRERFQVRRDSSNTLLMRRAKEIMGLSGVRCRKADFGDQIALYPYGSNTVLFVSYVDTSAETDDMPGSK